MKELAIALIAGAAFAGAACAVDIMVYPAKSGSVGSAGNVGSVSFNHQQHIAVVKDCKACHGTDKGGKIKDFGKDFAHKTCKGCHQVKKGPTQCGECHK